MNVQDQTLGVAITSALKESDGNGSCPGLEQIACLVEGTLAGPERDALLGHLALCGKCRQIFCCAKELAQEETVEAVAVTGRRRYLFPSSLAAAAVLVVAVTLTFKHSPAPQPQVVAKLAQPAPAVATVQPKPASPPPTAVAAAPAQPAMVARAESVLPDSLARSLAAGADLQQLCAASGGQGKSFGFAGEGGGNSAALRIGMTAVDLEVALLADDNDRAQGAATRLGSLIEPLSGDSAGMERLVEKLEKGEKGRSHAGKSAAVVRLVPRDQLPYLRFGAWAEAARIAARTGNAAFLSKGVPAGITRELKAAPETAKALRELDLKLKKSKGEVSSLEADLDSLMHSL